MDRPTMQLDGEAKITNTGRFPIRKDDIIYEYEPTPAERLTRSGPYASARTWSEPMPAYGIPNISDPKTLNAITSIARDFPADQALAELARFANRASGAIRCALILHQTALFEYDNTPYRRPWAKLSAWGIVQKEANNLQCVAKSWQKEFELQLSTTSLCAVRQVSGIALRRPFE